jgi:hypothetical protein
MSAQYLAAAPSAIGELVAGPVRDLWRKVGPRTAEQLFKPTDLGYCVFCAICVVPVEVIISWILFDWMDVELL